MKKIISTLSLVISTFLYSYAQNVNNRATWVIESQSEHPKTQTVHFYDDNLKLVYSETINARLNINKKKVQKALNLILDSLLTQQNYRSNKNVLAVSFKIKN